MTEMVQEMVPGLAIAVVHDQKVIYDRGLGTTSVEAGGCAVTADHIFRIGSITKILTATVILRLVDAGMVELNEPVTRYVPWAAFSEPSAVGSAI